VDPEATVVDEGEEVTAAAVVTVKVAAVVVAEPVELVNTARNCAPESVTTELFE
jgi:hypothetical protein